MQLVDEEALEYVPEYTYVGQLISFRDNAGKEIKKENWNGLEQVQESRIYTDRQILKIRDKDVQKIRRISSPIVWRSNMVTYRERKEDAPNLRVEDGTKNIARCKSDRVTSAEITARTITKDIVGVAHSFKWKWGRKGWGGEAMWFEWTSADGQRLGQ